MAALLGCPERASRLFGTTDMLLDRLGISIWPVDEIDYNRHFDLARAALGEVAFDAEYAAGWEMPLEQAIAEAMAMAELAQAMAMDDALPIAGERPFNLTPRERDVLRLLAMHATNREIANKLSISPRTVMHHVSQLLSKLGVSNRRDAAAMAARFGVG